MGWSCRLLDSMTGLLAEPVDVPSLSWSLTVSGASLRTTPDEEGVVEAGSASGLRLPWEAVPGATREARMRAVAPYRRGLVLAMDGRPAVAPEDILHLVTPVLRHRISCNYKARAEGITETEIIRRILEKTGK